MYLNVIPNGEGNDQNPHNLCLYRYSEWKHEQAGELLSCAREDQGTNTGHGKPLTSDQDFDSCEAGRRGSDPVMSVKVRNC